MATLRVPQAFATIQDAVNAATAGDHIRVSAGYAGNESVVVDVDDLVINAPATVPGIVLIVSPGIARVATAGTSNIQINGNTEDNELIGNSGNNVFFSGSGTDTLHGRDGDDTFTINGSAGTVRGGAGLKDTVLSGDLGGYSFAGVENLDAAGAGAIYGSVAQFASFSSIYDSGAPGSQLTLRLGGTGGTLNLSTRVLGATSVAIFDNALTSGVTVTASINDDFMRGSGFDDTLNGHDGDDLIVGSGGTDVLNGNAGDDTFRIEFGAAGRLNGGLGTDTVESNDLGTLSLAGVEALDTVGFEQVAASVVQLRAFASITDSVAAADAQIGFLLTGEGGTINLMTRVLGAQSVFVVDSGLTTSATIIGTVNNDYMVASANLNGLRGEDGNDTFEILFGGGGAGGTVVGGAGSDTVRSNDLGTFALSQVEILDTYDFSQVFATVAQLGAFDTITDSLAAADSQINFLVSGAGGTIDLRTSVAGAHSAFVADNGLTGQTTVIGTVNDDLLVASTNLSKLRGDDGDDTFRIHFGTTGQVNGGDGTDTVRSNNLGTFTLSEVEILDTDSFNAITATAAQLSAFGTITDSVAAADSQITVFLQGGHSVIDLSTRVAGAHSVNVQAGALTAGAKVTGSVNADSLDGSTFADVLAGGGGLDSLTGAGGDDTFLFKEALVAGNVADVTDFAVGGDRIALSSSIFTQAGPTGGLSAAAFFAGAGALDADDRIGYDSATGNLLYDADGTGAGAAQVFGTLAPGLAVTAADFRIVA
jgi:serralysin